MNFFNDYRFIYDQLRGFVEKKVQAFLGIYNLEDEYESIQMNAQNHYKNSHPGIDRDLNFLSDLINGVIETVSKEKAIEQNDICQAFEKHYLS